MRGRILSLASLAVVLLVLAVAVPIAAQDVPVPAQVGERPDAPSYALHGPYWVGTRTIVMGADTDRPMNVMIWYPASNPQGLPEETVYSVETGSGLPPMTISGKAIADAAFDPSAAPYPLVVYSPGGGASPAHHASLIEHLASYGFVVMGGEHPGNTSVDFFGSFAGPEAEAAYLEKLLENEILRPKDLTRLIDFAADLNEPDASFAGMIDSERVTAAGVSFGGYAALVAGGARLDFGALRTWLESNTPADPIVASYPDYEETFAEMIEGVTLGELWPSMGDLRVDNIVALSPGDVPLMGDAGLAAVTVPTFLFTGSSDPGAQQNALWAYTGVSSTEKVLLTLEGGGHNLVNFVCEPWAYEWGLSSFCLDDVWDMQRAHDLMNHFATAFLLAEVYGNADARAALAPEAASFPGVEYSAVGF